MPLTLASNAITFTDNTALSSGVIGTAQLSAGAVTASKIASNAITTASIAASAVTADKINLTRSLSSVGFIDLPGGLTFQWGGTESLPTTPGDTNITLTFPKSFSNMCLRAFVSIVNSSTTNDDVFARIISYNTTQITVRAENTTGVNSGTRIIDYFVIGF
jgi:hypothetical protein